MTKVDIFSGFLGAGKTTLIKKLIAEAYQGEKVVLIENEFGEIGVDKGFLKDTGIEINQMNAGCICCTLVGDFGRALNQVIAEYDPDYVINFAAESHVDRSIANPEIFVTTNVLGTVNLLQCCKEAWYDASMKHWKPGKKYLQVSTDEVYGALGAEGYFMETTPINPHSPYSSSKASADHFVQAFHDTYGMPINITRCSNN